MKHVKTAISVQRTLFKRVERLASELNISRSRLFALAVAEFLERYENKKLLEELNHAYEELPTNEEPAERRERRRRHRKLVEGDW